MSTQLRRTEGVNSKGWSTGRFYETPDGKKYPSVTNILGIIAKPALINWAAKEERLMVSEAAANLYEDAPLTPKMSRPAFLSTLETRLGKEKAHRKLLRKAGDIGTECHALIEWNLRQELKQEAGPEPRLSDKAMWAFASWENWRKSVKLEPISIEQIVWSETDEHAGTLDLLARVDGRLTVLDWKTGKAIYWEALLQNAAYSKSIFEMGHAAEMPAGIIVRLPKVETDPGFDTLTIEPEDMPRHYGHFMCARGLWQGQHEMDKKDPWVNE